jgi:hypothetical protein
MSFKSFFKHLGHAIEHAAKDVAHGVENIAKDVAQAGEAAIHMADDVAHGRFKAALNDAVRVAQCSVKAFTELPKMEVEAICDATTDMHLNKSLDKMAQKVKGFEEKAVQFERNVADKMIQDVADGIEGTVKGTINAAKDIASGHFREACGDLMGAAGSALQVACDLTPEGMAANAVVGAMQEGHVGSSALQNVVGDIVGGPKGLFKRAAEAGAGMAAGAAANEIAQKVGSAQGAGGGTGADTLLAAGAAAPDVADALSGRRGHHGHHDAGHHTGAGDGADKDAPHVTKKDAETSNGKGTEKTAGKDGCQGTDKGTDKTAGKDGGKGTDKGTDKTAGKDGAKDTDKTAGKGTDKTAGKDADKTAGKDADKTAGKDADKTAGKDADKTAGKDTDKDAGKGKKTDEDDDSDTFGDGVQAGIDAASGGGVYGAAGPDIAASEAAALATMAAQDAIARIQNAIALNQAKNQIEDELGKGVKALAQ